jgi:hypothetical protein
MASILTILNQLLGYRFLFASQLIISLNLDGFSIGHANDKGGRRVDAKPAWH